MRHRSNHLRRKAFMSLSLFRREWFRLVPSQVGQIFHSHHRYFADPRLIGSTVHLRTDFHNSTCLDCSLQTSPSFTHNLDCVDYAYRSIRAAFQGVTPSFHLSDYQFYKFTIMNFLSIFTLFGLVSNLSSQERVAPCSILLSRNALSRYSTVDMTEAIACFAELSAAPVNHLAWC